MPTDPQIWKRIASTIRALKAHTMCNAKRWEGHPSIPERVFGPTGYLPSPIRKASRFQNTGKPSRATKIESFEATKLLNTKILSMSARFSTWFDSAFANSDPLCKRMKAWQGGDHPPKSSNPGQSRAKPRETTQLEYRLETQDICLIMEIEEDDPLACDGEGT